MTPTYNVDLQSIGNPVEQVLLKNRSKSTTKLKFEIDTNYDQTCIFNPIKVYTFTFIDL